MKIKNTRHLENNVPSSLAIKGSGVGTAARETERTRRACLRMERLWQVPKSGQASDSSLGKLGSWGLTAPP